MAIVKRKNIPWGEWKKIYLGNLSEAKANKENSTYAGSRRHSLKAFL